MAPTQEELHEVATAIAEQLSYTRIDGTPLHCGADCPTPAEHVRDARDRILQGLLKAADFARAGALASAIAARPPSLRERFFRGLRHQLDRGARWALAQEFR